MDKGREKTLSAHAMVHWRFIDEDGRVCCMMEVCFK